jgi:hypothetical protein
MKALERASGICNSCMNLVKSFLLKTAIEMHVPLVVYGWSPGQAPVQSSVFKTNAPMIRQMHKAMTEPIRKMVGERLSGFLAGGASLRKGCDAGVRPVSLSRKPARFHGVQRRENLRGNQKDRVGGPQRHGFELHQLPFEQLFQ